MVRQPCAPSSRAREDEILDRNPRVTPPLKRGPAAWCAAAVAGALAALAGSTLQAAAQNATSAYTKLELDTCQVVAQDRTSGSIAWSCEGYDGMKMWVAEGDLRYFVSFGPKADRQAAARQTLPLFNTINDTIEWRLGADGKPFASILRWFTSFDDGREGQVLVVTRIARDGVCHVAYVDARANANANELARQAADTLAGNFDCRNGTPVTVGRAGSSL